MVIAGYADRRDLLPVLINERYESKNRERSDHTYLIFDAIQLALSIKPLEKKMPTGRRGFTDSASRSKTSAPDGKAKEILVPLFGHVGNAWLAKR